MADSMKRAASERERLRRLESKRKLKDIRKQQKETAVREKKIVEAACVGDAALVRELLDPELLEPSSATLGDALFAAVDRSFLDIALTLIRFGVSARDPKTNRTAIDGALLCAAKEGSLEQVEELVKKGANIAARTEYGATPLHLAASGGKRRSLVEYLCEKCTPANKLLEATTADGTTPFLEAVNHGHIDNAEALLNAGAELYAEDASGRNALDITTERGDDPMTAFVDEQFNMTEVAKRMIREAEAQRDEAIRAQLAAEKERDAAMAKLREAEEQMKDAIELRTEAENERDQKLEEMHDKEEERDNALAEMKAAEEEKERMVLRHHQALRDLERAKRDLSDLEAELQAMADERKCCYILRG